MSDERLSDLVNGVLGEVLGQGDDTNGPNSGTNFSSPEEYRTATGRRFRMTRQEIEQYGSTAAGRQQAFESRQATGALSQ
jgi:hypothetical protein